MNIEDLKAVWKQYDAKLLSTQAIQDKIIASMIADRSSVRFAAAKRNYKIGILWMTLCLAFSVVVLFTNPFDYYYKLQYAPTIIFAIGLLIMIAALVRTLFRFNNIAITHQTVAESLQTIIAIYTKPRRFVHYTVVIFLFSQVILFPLSFLPKAIEQTGLWSALAERVIPMLIGGSLLFIAFRLGAFKDKRVDFFRQDLDELTTLKGNLQELHDHTEGA